MSAAVKRPETPKLKAVEAAFAFKAPDALVSPSFIRRRSSFLTRFILSKLASPSPDTDTSEDDAWPDSPHALRLARFSYELIRRSSRSPLFASSPFFASGVGLNEEPPSPTHSALREIIANKDSRQALVNSLLEVKGEHVQKIRFVSCVDEFQQLPASKNKSEKGRDIYRFFLADRAMFKCTDAPERYLARAANGVYDDYLVLRAIFLEQLANHEDVRQAVDRIWLY
ncbi:hypothetical protein BASA81_006533 [Batrachochytrium salamandrivorans]|nr:hypothetical protein BASA81_006533 [Batrachochytrium salamandrivorans]